MKRYPLTVLCIIAIWVVSLMPVPETPLDNVAFIDKWTHLVMYGTLTLLLFIETIRAHRGISFRGVLLRCLPLPIVMGGLTELAQAYCTNGVRSGDWLDFAANTLGTFLTFFLAAIARRIFTRS